MHYFVTTTVRIKNSLSDTPKGVGTNYLTKPDLKRWPQRTSIGMENRKLVKNGA